MPTKLTSPRQSFKRTELKSLEKYMLALSSAQNNSSVLYLLSVLLQNRGKMEFKVNVAVVGMLHALAAANMLNSEIAALPHQRPTTCGPLKDCDDFTEPIFYSQFRFRKEHFWNLLQAMRFTDAAGRPLTIKFGKPGHRHTMRTDHLLMILLRRLAFPSRWIDLALILGGHESTLSRAYNFILKKVHHDFCHLVSDLRRWQHKFPQFAQRLTDMGAPFHNLIAFVDGHFDHTARPGGDGCVRRNLKDYQVYNHLHHDHGLMFQGLVLVNGWCMCWGPWRGAMHDAKTVVKAEIIQDLHAICQELGEEYSHFADSAYPRSRYMQTILKQPPGGSLSQRQRRFNALMARFRIVIENLFAEVVSTWAALQHKENKKLGAQDVGKMFPVSMLLHNCRAVFYGSQTSNYFGLDGMLELSLTDILDG